VRSGNGGSFFTLDADTGRIGTAALDLGAGANNADLRSADGLRIGKLGILSKAGAPALLDRVSLDGVRVRETTIVLGDANSALSVARIRARKFTASLGGGADDARMDDSTFLGDLTMDTGAGADAFAIDIDGVSAGAFTARGKVNVNLGAGDDTMLVANGDATSKAVFTGPIVVDGGAGEDTYTAHPTNATFGIIAVLIGI
jgi:hypothetical protein